MQMAFVSNCLLLAGRVVALLRDNCCELIGWFPVGEHSITITREALASEHLHHKQERQANEKRRQVAALQIFARPCIPQLRRYAVVLFQLTISIGSER